MTNKPYSNTKATLAIAKASFRSIMRSPSAVVFSLAFPLIFIVVFANIGGSAPTVDVGVAKDCDTSNNIYKVLKTVKMVNLITKESAADMDKDLSKGAIDAILDIKVNPKDTTKQNTQITAFPFSTQKAAVTVNVQYTKASQKGGIFKSVLNNILF